MIQASSFGTIFRIQTFGESHGRALGVVIDGCPAGLELDLELIAAELRRRRPGQSKLVSPRAEKDEVEFYSGVFEGKTTGTPIMAMVLNSDVRSKDYSEIKDLFRPGHADFTYFAKYGHRDYRGGGRSSARETIGRVVGGAIAKQLLAKIGVSFYGGVTQIGNVICDARDWAIAETNDLRCVDSTVLEEMENEVKRARKERDSVGGVVEVVAEGVPVGLGEPVFAKIDAAIGAAMFSLPAVKGVEIGAGFSVASIRGTQNNDEMSPSGYLKNDHGGTLGGLSSGAPIVVRMAIKPTSSIPQDLNTIDKNLSPAKISTKGRHDPCVAIRAVPIAEAMLAIVLVDFWLQDAASASVREHFYPRDEMSYGMSNSVDSSSDES